MSEFVVGRWDILDEDRPAQKRGEPYWTLMPPLNSFYGDDDLCLTRGPFGRKSLEPETLIHGNREGGLDFASDEGRDFILAALNAYKLKRDKTGQTGTSIS